MDNKKIALLLLINAVIAFGFYFENRNANALELSSDQINIIPICKKIDNPELYKNDLFLSELKDIEYYTPFYVEYLRLLSKINNGDYVQALNLMSLITHLFYGILWFFLFFTLKRDYWIALMMSIFFRGIIWPPGAELLGISDLWTIMPRTVYVAFLPIPFLLYTYLKKFNIIIASFSLGLILNFHPISGVGGITIYFLIFILFLFYKKELFTTNAVKNILTAILFCFLGMLPYFYVYFVNIKAEINFDAVLFSKAFNHRISEIFTNPILFLQDWNRPVLYFFLSFFGLYYFFDKSTKKINFTTLLLTILGVLIIANSFYYIESFVNNTFNKNIRMSFQLIRFQKLIIILLQIGFYLFLIELVQKYNVSSRLKKTGLVVFLFLMVFSSQFPFTKIPLVSDDLISLILPSVLKVNLAQKDEKKSDVLQMMEYIKTSTNQDALFYGSFYIRVAGERSVTLDGKGAGMLIEGNPRKLINWYLDKKTLERANTLDKILFLKSKGVNYIFDKKEWPGLEVEKQFGSMKLYKINQYE